MITGSVSGIGSATTTATVRWRRGKRNSKRSDCGSSSYNRLLQRALAESPFTFAVMVVVTERGKSIPDFLDEFLDAI